MDLKRLFENIAELPGVVGVCVFSTVDGARWSRLPDDMSGADFDAGFESARPDMVALLGQMQCSRVGCDQCVLQFRDRWVMLRRSGEIVVFVVADDERSLTSARMMSNVALRHLDPQSLQMLVAAPEGEGAAEDGPAATRTSDEEPSAVMEVADARGTGAPDADEPPRKVRMYRGQPY